MGDLETHRDGELIAAYEQGEEGALRTVDGWIDAALREGFGSLRAEWEDLRQEVRARLIRNLRNGRFNGHSGLRTYVHRITRNVSIDLSRRAWRRHERSLEPQDDTVAGNAVAADTSRLEAHDLAGRLIVDLGEADRMLVEMVFGEHRSYAEIARHLGVTENAVKLRVLRCKQRILRHYARLTRG